MNNFKIQKLSDESWKEEMQDVLTCNDLWGYVSERIPKPTTPATAVTEWEDKDQKARAQIRLCADRSQLTYVVKATTSKATWDALKKTHQLSGPQRKSMHFRKLFGMRK